MKLKTFLELDLLESRPNLSRTTTSKNSDNIETELFKELRKIAKSLLGKDVSFVSVEDKKEIRDLIRNYIQDAYIEGMDYNFRQTDANTNLTPNDMQKIEQITDTTFNAFWKTLTHPKVMIEQFEDLPELDKTRVILANLADDIDDFRRNMLISLLAGISAASVGFLYQDASFSRIASTGIVKSLNLGTLANSTEQVEFVTRRDDRVCQICEPLDGNRYNVDPVTRIVQYGPLIPDDTHPNCRCRYLSISGEGVLVG